MTKTNKETKQSVNLKKLDAKTATQLLTLEGFLKWAEGKPLNKGDLK